MTKYANVPGIYKSVSTLIILSLPAAVWDLLPKDPAVAFIGFTDSGSLLRGHPLCRRKAPTFDAENSCEAPDSRGPERKKCKSCTRVESRKCERTTFPPISADDDHSYQLIRWRAAMMDCMVDTLIS